jgi:LysR family glycine cleavage system transcriptional activator
MTARVDSLKAIRAFLAGARLGNFSQAAEEMHLTVAGFSRQIHGLELRLGVKLFRRQGSSMELTESGEYMYSELMNPIRHVDDVLDAAAQQRGSWHAESSINIAVTRYISEPWLSYRFVEFYRRNPDLRVNFRPLLSANMSAMQDVDLAIFESHERNVSNCEALCVIEEFPVASPELADRFDAGEGLDKLPLLHYGSRNYWRGWLHRSNMKHVEWRNGPIITDFSVLKELVLAGEGVVLADKLSCDRFLRNGQMRILGDIRHPSHETLWLFINPASQSNADVTDFADWICTALLHDLGVKTA